MQENQNWKGKTGEKQMNFDIKGHQSMLEDRNKKKSDSVPI